MAPLAGLQLESALERLTDLVAIAILVQSQAISVGRSDPTPGTMVGRVYEAVRETVPVWTDDRLAGDDIAAVRELIAKIELLNPLDLSLEPKMASVS